jgi:N-acylneuraminate cytidylyltransferase
MKILALICARGGSQRLPGKNIRMLGGRPLIVWSIEVAKNIPEICDVLVSTDDSSIAAVSIEAGAYVPWLRPAEMATATASSVEVALHAVDWYEAEKELVDGILLLQPTSPFRSELTMKRGIRMFSESGYQTVLGVSPVDAHPMWMFKQSNGYLIPFMDGKGMEMRSQDLDPLYLVNGSFYLTTPSSLREFKSLAGGKVTPLVIDSEQEALDIDTEWDWSIAEMIIDKVK